MAQIQQIHDHISQVATAAEQQSAVSDDINKNLMKIGDTANVIGQEGSSSQQLSGRWIKRPQRSPVSAIG